MAQVSMTVRMDSNLKASFDELCAQFGMSANAAMNIFANAVVRQRKIPFEIKAEPIEEVRRKARLSYERMRADAAAAGMQDLSLDEINEIIREVRYGDK